MKLRLLADDLTGALDTAAEFVPLSGPVPVYWPAIMPPSLQGSAALDSATREMAADAAGATVGRLCVNLRPASIAFKKIDSLIRGATLSEIAACMRAGPWRHAILAPAFPFQHRITRGGRQWTRTGEDTQVGGGFGDGTWTQTGPDLVAGLNALGVPARLGQGSIQAGVNVFDAEDDAALQEVARIGQASPHPLLWIGTGGLAQALTAAAQHKLSLLRPVPTLTRPVLGLFGSDQVATARQLAACGAHWMELEHDTADQVNARINATGLALVSFRLADGLDRAAASRIIAARVAGLASAVSIPATVMVAGGETLRGLCEAMQARALRVTGRMLPGVPCSVVEGGRWNGVTIVSKSGAFGPPDLLRRLLLEERTAS